MNQHKKTYTDKLILNRTTEYIINHVVIMSKRSPKRRLYPSSYGTIDKEDYLHFKNARAARYKVKSGSHGLLAYLYLLRQKKNLSFDSALNL